MDSGRSSVVGLDRDDENSYSFRKESSSLCVVNTKKGNFVDAVVVDAHSVSSIRAEAKFLVPGLADSMDKALWMTTTAVSFFL